MAGIIDQTPPSPFRLSPQERDSPIWSRLGGYLHDRLEVLRIRLEKEQTEAETASIRGQIKMIRSIIGVAAEDRPPLAWVDANAPPNKRPKTKEEQLQKFGL